MTNPWDSFFDSLSTPSHRNGVAAPPPNPWDSFFNNNDSSDDENDFQRWYAERARRLRLNPNPDDPQHHYDYRAAHRAGAEPDDIGHWPSEFKTADHPRRYLFLGGVLRDTETGKAVRESDANYAAARKLAVAAEGEPGVVGGVPTNAVGERNVRAADVVDRVGTAMLSNLSAPVDIAGALVRASETPFGEAATHSLPGLPILRAEVKAAVPLAHTALSKVEAATGLPFTSASQDLHRQRYRELTKQMPPVGEAAADTVAEGLGAFIDPAAAGLSALKAARGVGAGIEAGAKAGELGAEALGVVEKRALPRVDLTDKQLNDELWTLVRGGADKSNARVMELQAAIRERVAAHEADTKPLTTMSRPAPVMATITPAHELPVAPILPRTKSAALTPVPALVTDPPLITGIKNAVTDAERASRGLPEIETAARRGYRTGLLDYAKQRVDGVGPDRIDPRLLAAEIDKSPRPISDEEDAVLMYDRMRLYNEHKDLTSAIDDAILGGNKDLEITARTKRAVLDDAIDVNDKAVKKAGTEWSASGNARKLMIRQDYSLASITQRARVAKGAPLDASAQAHLEGLSREIQAASARLDDYSERVAKLEADRSIARMQKVGERKGAFGARQAIRAATREELAAEWDTLGADFRKLASTPRMGLDPELVKVMGEMARNRVQLGITDVGAVVDHVYQAVKDHIDGITPRDVRDAISGYGATARPSQDALARQLRDARAQMRLISAYEDASSGKRPLATRAPRESSSPRVQALRRQVDEAMRANGVDSNAAISADEQARSVVDATKSRIEHQLKGFKVKAGDADSIAERDRLQLALASVSDENVVPQQRIAQAEQATQRAIADLEHRITTGDVAAKRRTVTPWSPKISELKQRHAQLRAQLDELRDAASPHADPTTVRLRAYKQRLARRADEIESQLRDGNFEPKAKPQPLLLDPEAHALRAKVEALKARADDEVRRLELASRTPAERAADKLVKWRRAVILSGGQTLGKLTTAASMRGITTPIEEGIGGLLRHIPGLDTIDAMAPREGGGLSVKAETAALRQLFESQTYSDIASTAKTGRSSLDVLYGHKRTDLPPEALEFFGRLHGALKVLPKRAEFYRSLEKRAAHALRNGLDINAPTVQAGLAAASYNDAQRAILMNDNLAVSAMSVFKNYLHNKGAGGVARAIEIALPIVKVPTNFVAESTSYLAGGPKALAKILLSRGLQKLGPDGADYVIRNTKKQTIGLAMMAIGYAGADDVGGYYRKGEVRKEGDVEPGGLRIFGVNIPHFALHSPALEPLQIGATLKRVNNAYAETGKDGSLAEGLRASTMGLAEQTPFYEEAFRATQAAQSTAGWRGYVGDIVRGTTIPPDVQRTARVMDQSPSPSVVGGTAQVLGFGHADTTKRYPSSLAQEVELGVPGLRETVPAHKLPGTRFGMTPWGVAPDDAAVAPLDAEALRLERPLDFAEQTVADPMEHANGSHRSTRVKLSASEYETYIRESGRMAQQQLTAMLADPSYASADVEQQREMWDHWVSASRQYARMTVLMVRHTPTGGH